MQGGHKCLIHIKEVCLYGSVILGSWFDILVDVQLLKYLTCSSFRHLPFIFYQDDCGTYSRFCLSVFFYKEFIAVFRLAAVDGRRTAVVPKLQTRPYEETTRKQLLQEIEMITPNHSDRMKSIQVCDSHCVTVIV